jgi:hypothetical protein
MKYIWGEKDTKYMGWGYLFGAIPIVNGCKLILEASQFCGRGLY